MTAIADAGALTLGTATSGGTQTVTAYGALTFTQLTTTGTASDPGDVVLSARAAGVNGGSISAAGLVSINGVGITFDTIGARAGVNLNSSADISGNAITTQGNIDIAAAGTTYLNGLSGAVVSLATPGSLTVNDLTVIAGIDLAATNVVVGALHQASGAPGELALELTGFQGSVGHSAALTIDAPNGIYIPRLAETTVNIGTNAQQITIADALLTGTMRITTATSNLWFNDVSSQPVLGNDVQFFRLGDEFYLSQNGISTTTNATVVSYGSNAIIHEDVNGIIFNGASLVRDIDRQGRVGDDNLMPALDDGDDSGSTLWHFPVLAYERHLAALRKQVLTPLSGPAVNMEGRSASDAAFKILFSRRPHP